MKWWKWSQEKTKQAEALSAAAKENTATVRQKSGSIQRMVGATQWMKRHTVVRTRFGPAVVIECRWRTHTMVRRVSYPSRSST